LLDKGFPLKSCPSRKADSCWVGMVVHTCNPNYSEGGGRRTAV
jgi:hypothetical protein